MSAWQTAVELIPDVVKLVGSLVDAGMSFAEAKEVARRDIQSRVALYERQKAEDDAALEAKHGRGPHAVRPPDDPYER